MTRTTRSATSSDLPAIRACIAAAFGAEEGPEIAALVSTLLADPTAEPVLSLVAESGGVITGHVLFTAVRIDGAGKSIRASILAPLCVHPEHQGAGIGGSLIDEGLRELEKAGCDLVFVLGHPGFYPRHGFTPAGTHGLDAPYPIAPENADAWMVRELRPGVLGTIRGTAVCADALMDGNYWEE